jgi:hypothetical protein
MGKYGTFLNERNTYGRITPAPLRGKPQETPAVAIDKIPHDTSILAQFLAPLEECMTQEANQCPQSELQGILSLAM